MTNATAITMDEAAEICQILDEELDADFAFDPTVAQSFMHYITTHPHAEWRIFMTRGIKFRNGGGAGWRVDCYPEEETKSLRRRLNAANERLSNLASKRE